MEEATRREEVIRQVIGYPLVGDFNEDGVVDLLDLQFVAAGIGAGTHDVLDVTRVINHFGERTRSRLLNGMLELNCPKLPLIEVCYAGPGNAVERAQQTQLPIVTVDYEYHETDIDAIAKIARGIHGAGKLCFVGSVFPQVTRDKNREWVDKLTLTGLVDCVLMEHYFGAGPWRNTVDGLISWAACCRGLLGDSCCVAPWVTYTSWRKPAWSRDKGEDAWLELLKAAAMYCDFTILWNGGYSWKRPNDPLGAWYYISVLAMNKAWDIPWTDAYWPVWKR